MKKISSYELEIVKFFLLLALVLGSVMRVYPPARADFPLVDGGMFHVMTRDLQAGHYMIPTFTTYNQSNIPFAYPPLGFYLAGSINSLTGISLLKILQWLPAIITILNIPLFYFLAKRTAGAHAKAALATLIFALTPNSYWWNIVGGGLTRSLGALFFTATLLCVHQMYTRRTTGWIIAAVFSASAVVLSHPAWALHAALISILLWLFFGRDREGIIHSVIVALGVLLLTSPWWLTVIFNHGLNVLLNAGQDAYSRFRFWEAFFTLSFTDEYTPVIALFGVCGFFIHLARKDYFLPAWVLLCLFADLRSGMPVSIFAFSVMAATLLADGIAARLVDTDPGQVSLSNAWLRSLGSGWGRLFFGFITLLFAYNAFQTSNTLSYKFLSVEERSALNWVKENTPSSARFLVLDGQINPVTSPLTEWFPALAERRSIATIQGTEWLQGERSFLHHYDAIKTVLQCFHQNEKCLYSAQGQLLDRYDYLMLSGDSLLGEALKNAPGYSLVYSSDSLLIFHVGK